MTILQVFKQADSLLQRGVRREIMLQGHHLTGALEASVHGTISTTKNEVHLEGVMASYGNYVNWGVTPDRASFRQFPFVVEYWKQRGLGDKEAKRAAAATIKKWMKEGMSTQASKRFSKTGDRQHFIAQVEVNTAPALHTTMSYGIDQAVSTIYNRTKSETV